MQQELKRIEEIFDGWYYNGFSITNRYSTLGPEVLLDNFNEFLKWRTILSILLQIKPELSNYNILDAGCGNGNSLRKLLEFGADPKQCYGIDISNKVISYAKDHSPATVRYEVGTIEKMVYPSLHFDIILNFGVLIHVLDDEYIKEVSREFARVLKKDGILLCIVSDEIENFKWGPTMDKITRNFDLKNQGLQKLFNEFHCIGVFQLYNDVYPNHSSEGNILSDFEKRKLDTSFKLCVFTLKLTD